MRATAKEIADEFAWRFPESTREQWVYVHNLVVRERNYRPKRKAAKKKP